MQNSSKLSLRLSVIVVSIIFLFINMVGSILLTKQAYAYEANIPMLGTLVELSDAYSLPFINGVRYDHKNPLNLEFIIDQGDADSVSIAEQEKMIRYFLAGLTVPEDKLWVNLSPYEEDRVIEDNVLATEIGETLLNQDYILKQLSSSLTHPDTELGAKYWEMVNRMAYESDEFNKVWIVPEKISIYDSEGTLFISETEFGVKTEADYNALKASKTEASSEVDVVGGSSVALKEVIIPQIKKDVNYGRNFAELRQMLYSIIVAQWFKRKFRKSLYSFYYDSEKMQGVDVGNPEAKEVIFERYVQAFTKGAYDIKKKERLDGRLVKRRYFSGGVVASSSLAEVTYVEGKHVLEQNPTVALVVTASLGDDTGILKAVEEGQSLEAIEGKQGEQNTELQRSILDILSLLEKSDVESELKAFEGEFWTYKKNRNKTGAGVQKLAEDARLKSDELRNEIRSKLLNVGFDSLLFQVTLRKMVQDSDKNKSASLDFIAANEWVNLLRLGYTIDGTSADLINFVSSRVSDINFEIRGKILSEQLNKDRPFIERKNRQYVEKMRAHTALVKDFRAYNKSGNDMTSQQIENLLLSVTKQDDSRKSTNIESYRAEERVEDVQFIGTENFENLGWNERFVLVELAENTQGEKHNVEIEILKDDLTTDLKARDELDLLLDLNRTGEFALNASLANKIAEAMVLRNMKVERQSEFFDLANKYEILTGKISKYFLEARNIYDQSVQEVKKQFEQDKNLESNNLNVTRADKVASSATGAVKKIKTMATNFFEYVAPSKKQEDALRKALEEAKPSIEMQRQRSETEKVLKKQEREEYIVLIGKLRGQMTGAVEEMSLRELEALAAYTNQGDRHILKTTDDIALSIEERIKIVNLYSSQFGKIDNLFEVDALAGEQIEVLRRQNQENTKTYSKIVELDKIINSFKSFKLDLDGINRSNEGPIRSALLVQTTSDFLQSLRENFGYSGDVNNRIMDFIVRTNMDLSLDKLDMLIYLQPLFEVTPKIGFFIIQGKRYSEQMQSKDSKVRQKKEDRAKEDVEKIGYADVFNALKLIDDSSSSAVLNGALKFFGIDKNSREKRKYEKMFKNGELRLGFQSQEKSSDQRVSRGISKKSTSNNDSNVKISKSRRVYSDDILLAKSADNIVELVKDAMRTYPSDADKVMFLEAVVANNSLGQQVESVQKKSLAAINRMNKGDAKIKVLVGLDEFWKDSMKIRRRGIESYDNDLDYLSDFEKEAKSIPFIDNKSKEIFELYQKITQHKEEADRNFKAGKAIRFDQKQSAMDEKKLEDLIASNIGNADSFGDFITMAIIAHKSGVMTGQALQVVGERIVKENGIKDVNFTDFIATNLLVNAPEENDIWKDWVPSNSEANYLVNKIASSTLGFESQTEKGTKKLGGIDLKGLLDGIEIDESTSVIRIPQEYADRIQGLNFELIGNARLMPLNEVLAAPIA